MSRNSIRLNKQLYRNIKESCGQWLCGHGRDPFIFGPDFATLCTRPDRSKLTRPQSVETWYTKRIRILSEYGTSLSDQHPLCVSYYVFYIQVNYIPRADAKYDIRFIFNYHKLFRFNIVCVLPEKESN